MKRLPFFLFIPLTILASVEFGGFLEVGKTAFTGLEDSPYYPVHNRLRFEGRAGRGDTRAMMSIEARYYDYSNVTGTESLSELELHSPVNFNIYEAYFSVTGFIFDNLDMKVGKQRVAWGSADRFNPTDNINPVDLSDPFNFGEHLPSIALQFNYYIDDWVFSFVGVPNFSPVLLPSGEIFFEEIPVGDIHLPENNPVNGSVAFKVGKYILNFDLSLSYYYGFDKLPSPDSSGYLVNETYGFNRTKVIGFDFAGELFSVGLWGEVGYFMPDEYPFRIKAVTYDTLDNPIPYNIDTVYLKEPYTRATFGFDYTLPGGIYINTQFIHGMDFERDLMLNVGKMSNLGDFIIARIEKDFMNNDLLFSLTGIGEKRTNYYAYGILPDIEFSPFVNGKINIGYLHTFGDNDTFFGDFKDYKMAYLRFKYEF